MEKKEASDFWLIEKMRMGDEQALEDFVKKYYSQILTYCRIHTQDSGYGEDLTQETFIRFFHALPSYRHRGKAGNFLYTIAGNLCRDYHRKRKELSLESLTRQEEGYGTGWIEKGDLSCFSWKSRGETGGGWEDWDTRITVRMALAQLPDQLLQLGLAMSYFNLYSLGGRIFGAVPLLLVLYTVLGLVLIPVLYREFSSRVGKIRTSETAWAGKKRKKLVGKSIGTPSKRWYNLER